MYISVLSFFSFSFLLLRFFPFASRRFTGTRRNAFFSHFWGNATSLFTRASVFIGNVISKPSFPNPQVPNNSLINLSISPSPPSPVLSEDTSSAVFHLLVLEFGLLRKNCNLGVIWAQTKPPRLSKMRNSQFMNGRNLISSTVFFRGLYA